MKLHIILTPPNLPLPRGGAEGGGVLSMHLHMKMVLVLKIRTKVLIPILCKAAHYFNPSQPPLTKGCGVHRSLTKLPSSVLIPPNPP
ncbi:hypothetical protein NIES4106_25340 [Fischerella sp. NIES-4106]|nr:hypothetical protein NIES4106_25340 [Fischerella sp. NIES-4106]